jgi:predicted ATPase with chaperone activity
VAHINEKKQDQKPNENKKDDIPFIKPKKIEPFHREIKKQSQKNNFEVDFSDIKGRDMAKRALQIAISGGHR